MQTMLQPESAQFIDSEMQDVADSPAKHYQLGQWRVRSDVSLPELGSPTTDSPFAADIRIRIGSEQDRFVINRLISPVLALGPNGSLCLQIPGTAEFHIHEGREVVVLPQPACTDADLQAFLLGPVTGLLCHQRSVLPILGACVASEGGTTLICGAPGSGKSTLAAALFQRGWSVLSDGIAIIESPPRAILTARSLRLWRDTLDRLGISTDGLAQSRAGQARFNYLPGTAHREMSREYPLSRIVIMDNPLHGQAGLQPLANRAAGRALSAAISQFHMCRRLSLAGAVRTRLQALVSNVEVFRLTFRPVFTEMDRTLDLMMERFGS